MERVLNAVFYPLIKGKPLAHPEAKMLVVAGIALLGEGQALDADSWATTRGNEMHERVYLPMGRHRGARGEYSGRVMQIMSVPGLADDSPTGLNGPKAVLCRQVIPN